MNGPTYLDIDERVELSAEAFVGDYLRRHRPVIVRGGVRDWPAFRKWNPQWFARTYPDISIPVAIGPRRGISRYEVMTLRDYVELMERRTAAGGEHIYLRQYNLFRDVPALLQDTPLPSYCPDSCEFSRNFWMGTNTVQPLHHDAHWRLVGMCNLFAQVYGRKRVILASPKETPYLYKRWGEKVDSHLSEVNIDDLDLERFPLMAHATLWKGELEAGDLLLIPLNFWHFMESFGASISVSMWWHPHKLAALAHRALQLAKDPMAAERLINDHAGEVTWTDIEALGGIDECRNGMLELPGAWRRAFLKLLAEDVRSVVLGRRNFAEL